MGQWFSRKKKAFVDSLVPKRIQTLEKRIHDIKTNISKYSYQNRNLEILNIAQVETLENALRSEKRKSKVYRTLKTLGLRPLSGGYTRKRKRFH